MEKEKILVVDDDKLLRVMARDILTREGYEVEEAENAQKALTLAAKQSFPLIVADIMMPGMSGLELIDEIKKTNSKTFFVVITAYGTMNLAIEALKKGAYDFLRKPFEPEELITSVSNAFLQIKTSRRNEELLKALKDKIEKLSELNLRIERGKATLQQIMESINTGVVVTDLNGTFLHINSAAKKMLGVFKNEKGIKLKISLKIHEQLTDLLKRGSPEENVVDQISIGVNNPSFYRVIVSPLKDNKGSILGRVMTFEDVTDLNKILMMESEFVSRASHKLRIPLTSISASAEFLSYNKAMESPELQGKMIGIISKEAEKLNSIITDIIDSSKMSAGTLNFQVEEGDLQIPITTSIEKVKPLFEKKGLELEVKIVGERHMAFFDSKRVEQVVSNLLSNALKFTQKGGKVNIVLSDFEEGDGQKYKRVSVADNGPGIPLSLQAKIFDKFKLMDRSDTGDVGGLGLGLPLSKYIIENLGGRIWFESQEGKGTTIHFIIPAFRKETLPILQQ